MRGRAVERASLGERPLDVSAGSLQVTLDHVVDAHLALKREVEPDLAEERSGWPGEVAVARHAVACGLARDQDCAPVRTAARPVDHVGC